MEPGPDSGRETVVTVLLGVWYEISDINGFYFLLGTCINGMHDLFCVDNKYFKLIFKQDFRIFSLPGA